uniref:Uncharacterized protein n=1 Tax=Arundo donax TaxID=35708 RepID=A0A0A9G0N6_ARUDO
MLITNCTALLFSDTFM